MVSTMQKVQAIGYVRRSTNRQEESLEQQREKLRGFAQGRGWELVEVYADDAISGSQMHRAGLDSLMAHAERSQEVGVVLAWERNRLARPKDPVDGLLLERRLIQAGKRVFYVATGQEADRSFTSGLVGFVEHYQNGDYLRKLSRDAMRGIVSRAQRGLWPCGMVPFGFDRLCLATDGQPTRIIRNMPDRSQMILHSQTKALIEHIQDGHRYTKPEHETVTLIHSEEGRVEAVRKLFADYLHGQPARMLRDQLNATGVRSIGGGVFTISTIHTILRNPAYKGTLMFNRSTNSKWHRFLGGKGGRSVERQGEGYEERNPEDWIVVENAWPAIVDADMFGKVQTKLDQARQLHQHAPGRSIRSNYLLSGALTCGVCGGRLLGQTDYRRKHKGAKVRKRRSYVCGVHHKGDLGRCPERYRVPADVVEGHILRLIQEDLQHLRGDPQLQVYIQRELAKVCGSQVETKKRLQATLSDMDSQVAKLTTHLSVLDMQTATTLGLYAKAKTLSDERQQVQSQLAAITEEVPEMPDAREIARHADVQLARLDHLMESGSLEENRELIRTYVKGITADPKAQEVTIQLLPALFSRIGTGG